MTLRMINKRLYSDWTALEARPRHAEAAVSDGSSSDAKVRVGRKERIDGVNTDMQVL